MLTAAARRTNGPDPRPYQSRLRAALDDDLDAPSARTALEELARTILADGTCSGAGGGGNSRGGGTGGGGNSRGGESAPAALRALAGLCGIELDRPLAPSP